MRTWLISRRLFSGDRGATAVEYALIVALIAVVIVVGVGVFGTQLNAFFTGLFNALGL
jgi:pilus assembly protein Flp/PilA